MPPKILVLWADESSANLGVAALARGSEHFLRSFIPEAEITYANYGHRPDPIPWGRTRSLVRERLLPRRGMLGYLGGFDLIWDTRSGDSFTSIYGRHRHRTMSLVHEFAVQSGTPTVMAPQTIGPFATTTSRLLARRSLHRSSLVFARDPESATAAAELGRPVDATTTDLVFAIAQPPESGQQRDVLLNVSGLLWNENPHVPAAGYRAMVRDIAEHLRRSGREVTLLAHVLDSPSPDNDVPAVQSLARELGGAEMIIPHDLDSVRNAISGSQLVIGARMHACLNALSVGVPTIPLAYSRKFVPLMDSVGWDIGFDLRTADLDRLGETVATVANDLSITDAIPAMERGRQTLASSAELVRGLLTS